MVSGLDWRDGRLMLQKQNSSSRGTVARGEKVQSVHHVVVAAHNGSIDPRPLNYVELEGSYKEIPTRSVGFENQSLPPVNRIANEPPGMW